MLIAMQSFGGTTVGNSTQKTMTDLRPITRMLTGKTAHRAYVMDRMTGKVVCQCLHDHRKLARAVECARRQLRQLHHTNRG